LSSVKPRPVLSKKTGKETERMDASRLLAWVVGLVAVAVGIAVVVSETTLVEHLTRLEMPTVAAHLEALVKETKLISWGLLSLVMLLFLSWSKLR